MDIRLSIDAISITHSFSSSSLDPSHRLGRKPCKTAHNYQNPRHRLLRASFYVRVGDRYQETCLDALSCGSGPMKPPSVARKPGSDKPRSRRNDAPILLDHHPSHPCLTPQVPSTPLDEVQQQHRMHHPQVGSANKAIEDTAILRSTYPDPHVRKKRTRRHQIRPRGSKGPSQELQPSSFPSRVPPSQRPPA